MGQQASNGRRGSSRDCGARRALLALVVLLSGAAPAFAAATPTPTSVDLVTVQVVNALSGQPLAALPIQAKRRSGDVFTWVASATTDANGRATMKLSGVSQGVRFAIFATPYNGGSVRSDDVVAPGAFTFRVGKMPVSVVAGGSNAPLANTKVTLKQKLADGTLKSIASGTTTAAGLILFDPLGLGAGSVYVLEALSPWDGSTQRSNEIRDAGGVTFVVGNAPLAVTVMDGISNAPLANLVVTAYERGLDGKLTWVRQRTSNSVGRATFDLPGLGSGRSYVLRVTAFNALSSESEDLRAAGEFAFKVGALKVKVVAGGSNKALAATKVDAYERRADGTLAWTKGGSTDAAGVIRFDLPGLGRGRTYVLRAKSAADGTTKSSNDIAQTGEMTFVVGNAPLTVTAVDAISGVPIAGLGFSAVERLADGTTKDFAWRTTDAAGKAVLDLPGLGSGRTYFLASWPFGTGKAVSDDLTAPGAYTYKVGKLKVSVVNGADGTPLANVDAWASEKRADGTVKWAAGGKTDAAGVIRFDLPGLGAGKVYVLEAKSPWDGSSKRSDDVTKNGSLTFAVGRAPLRVRVSNALSGDPLVGLKVTANRRDGTSLVWVAQQTTDASGRAVFDLDGLGAGATFVLSAAPYGSTVSSDDIREPGVLEFRVGTVELTVLNGATAAPLVATKVTAYAKNADGSWAWTKQATTDERGVIRFDLPGLGRGATYVFEAKSPADGSTKRSQAITAVGAVVFTVGNTPLVVTLQNGVSGERLPGVNITVNEKLASGEQRWVAQRATDGAGQAVFDLDGLGAGRTYVLYASVYNGGTSWSDDLTKPGPYTFRVGTLQVRTLSGATSAPLAAYKVAAYEVAAGGALTWAASGTTDAAGVIRFDLLGLRAGRVYRLQAKSPVDGSTKYSPDLTSEGAVDFVVGNAPLRVTLVNGVSGATLPGVKITAREVLADGSNTWVRELATDAAGVAAFDLDGLGSGRRYSLYAKPYTIGVTTEPVMAAGSVFFRVGTVPVTLVDVATNQPLVNRKLVAERKLDDGTRVWAAEGYTDAGGVVQFDLPGLSQNVAAQQPPAPRLAERTYVIRAVDPFGNGKKYYSGLLSQEGPVLMRVDAAVAAPPDFTAPRIAILNPLSGGNVDAEGFGLLGEASDNVSIASVSGSIADPVKGVSALAVAYNATLRQWTASVPAAAISAGQTITVSVTAVDQAQNRASASASFVATADAAPPQVSIQGPAAGASVPRSGFLVSGLATDDIGVTSVVATVDDARLGRTVTQTLGIGANGGWSFAVLSGQVSEGQTATVTVTARDAKNNQTAASVSLTVVGVDYLAPHLLNRITFGSTPELLAEVQRVGVDSFLDQQLNPVSIDDSQLNALLVAAPTSKAELQRQALLRMIYSRRQLLEVLTWFWDNHFNTDVNKTNNTVAYEVAENAALRANALGRFRDLLAVSAKSPAMLYYLDQAASRRDEPNENYPRELMELHTLSVDGGYTQTDVEQVARAFTGWTVVNGQFAFDAANHDTGAKVVLGQTLPAGRGIADGEQVLDILASHPSTASFICTKLSQLLVSDTPSPLLVGRCASEFLATQGSIAAVVRIIIRSPEFAAPQAFRAKVRTPVEMAVFWARALGATSDAASLPAAISDMGLRLFENPVPTGWSETGDDWINSNTLLQRFKHANRLVRNQMAGTTVDLRGYFSRNRQTTADGIVAFLLQQLFYGEVTPLEYDTAIGVLTDDGARPFFLTQSDAETRLQQMVGTVLTYPGGQFQ